MRTHAKQGLKRAGAFSMVGVANTLIDLLLLNIGIFILGLPVLIANIISVNAAMLFSYTANNRWVFGGGRRLSAKKALSFAVITLLGLYGLQTIVIYMLTRHWLLAASIVTRVLEGLGLVGYFSEDFIIANTAKVLATVVTAIWNFVLYKKYVFNSKEIIPSASVGDEG